MLFWPSNISINDGELREDGGGYFAALSQAWHNAEQSSEEWSEWHQLMVWAIFGGLHKLAIDEFSKGNSEINKKDIDIKYVEKKFSDNLFTNNEPCYPEQMRRAYRNDIKS